MTETNKAPANKAAKAKSPMNWPIVIVCAAGLLFIIWVWVNNYVVSHAAASPAPIASTK